MSDIVVRDYSFTVRLSRGEKATLETLAQRLNLDKSATVRKALHIACASGQSLPSVGRFVPVHAGELAFTVRLRGKAGNDG